MGERKQALDEADAIASMAARLEAYQRHLLQMATDRREANSYRGVADYAQLRAIVESTGGLVYAGWCGGPGCEARVKEETKATIRVLPSDEFRTPDAPRTCAVCGGTAAGEAIWARAY